MRVFQWTLWISGFALQVLVISSMLRGLYRRFPFVFAYCVVSLLGTFVQIAAREDRSLGARYYWLSEPVEQTLAYCIVIVLIYQALSPQHRALAGRWLIVAAVAVAIVSATIHWNEQLRSLWMTQLSRDLNFTAAILDLVLWVILVSTRSRDRLLLLVSGGLGIKFAGNAIGYSLPVLHKEWVTLRLLGRMVVPITYLLCLYVWWEAFRRAKKEPAALAVDNSG
jgi:hypothetical protein